MAIIVVGGGSRGVGKTSVVCGIIGALREYRWTAFKITPHRHRSEDQVGGWRISEETDSSGLSDTSRFLAAGAERALLVEVSPSQLPKAMPEVKTLLGKSTNAIFESNRVLNFLQPDRSVAVVDPAAEDVKVSARGFLSRADAVITSRGGEQGDSGQMKKIMQALDERPVFLIRPPEYVTPEIIEFVRKALSVKE
jgi:hypothetical protein